MDRSSIVRLLAIGAAVFAFMFFVLPKLTGSDGPKMQPIVYEPQGPDAKARPAEEVCDLVGPRFKAQLTSRSAGLRHLWLEGAKYSIDGRGSSPAMDMVTTPDHEELLPLRFDWRRAGAGKTPSPDGQVALDLFDWKLVEKTGSSCRFTYEDDKVQLDKTVRAVGRPFELEVEVTIKNKGAEKASHRASVETTAWRTEKEIEGGFGRQSPFLTTVECSKDGKIEEKSPGDFAPKDFTKPEYKENWFTIDTGKIDFAATSNFYFSQALAPVAGPTPVACQVQVWERGAKGAPGAGAIYRSRLAWSPKELGPGESATYKALQFIGPKERDVLASAGAGQHRFSDLIKLGVFSFIAKWLVWFLVKVHGVLGSWGVAIIILTISVRTLLFPLTWKTIKSGAKMRRMKPELDEINRKYADDAQQKQLATMELWRKHEVNPVAGCLPMVAQMPVWFALYTTLQTAAELYHTPFLWFSDLSAPDTFHFMRWDVPFILPILLGATTFVQQKIMPQQMDPAQQKMMQYLMPSIFTAMMLFLPAGLGVYMFTNSLLGIIQQLAVERYYASQDTGGGSTGIDVRDKKDGDDGDDDKRKKKDEPKKLAKALASQPST